MAYVALEAEEFLAELLEVVRLDLLEHLGLEAREAVVHGFPLEQPAGGVVVEELRVTDVRPRDTLGAVQSAS
ncbi:MAG: hypothetical protein ACRENE_12735 [Polyangiaceae bacterium]